MHHRITYMHVSFYQSPICRPVKTVHANLFAKNGMWHKFATTNSNLKNMVISDMHHRITYMYMRVNFPQNRICRPVKKSCTQVYLQNGMLHKFAITNSNFKKMVISDMHHCITYMHVNFQQKSGL